MVQTIGVLATSHIWVGLVEEDRLAGPVRIYPEPGQTEYVLQAMPADAIAANVAQEIVQVAAGMQPVAVGVSFPGIIHEGVIEDSPNLHQMKGYNLRQALSRALAGAGMTNPVCVLNDADAIATGIAATRGELERTVRIWYLGDGIGYGRYPQAAGPGEGGHWVVSLDEKERFCGCGGLGHLEGIMGQRAMRKRFLDMEPEEIFTSAREGDPRCAGFVNYWHRALAAASAISIHLDGSGKFYIAGPNADYVDTSLLQTYLHEMVRMSPLQGSTFEVVSSSHDLAIIGAAVMARRAAGPNRDVTY